MGDVRKIGDLRSTTTSTPLGKCLPPILPKEVEDMLHHIQPSTLPGKEEL